MAEKMKLRTCGEAWAFIAELWSTRKKTLCGIDVLDATDACGICWTLDVLADHGLISDHVFDRLVGQLHRFRPNASHGDFFWPIGDRKSRAAFCRKMAKKYSKEGAPK